MIKESLIICFILQCNITIAQFAPAALNMGTTAISKDSSIFTCWANKCTVSRGPQDISMLSLGNVSAGSESNALGMADGVSSVSLGDGGSAICEFPYNISDEAGFDFAVFENSFVDYFLELAFVEASSDGIHFFRFPSKSLTDTTEQVGSFDSLRCTQINNLAGKYIANYGTPFDLAELPDTSLLDKQNIKYVKVVDVVGCIQNQYCSRDFYGRKINDPWPTPFVTGGFDLEAIGVIHRNIASGLTQIEATKLKLYMDEAHEKLYLQSMKDGTPFQIFSMSGEALQCNIYKGYIDISSLSNGIFFIHCGDVISKFAKP
jgi:hypothetical protein